MMKLKTAILALGLISLLPSVPRVAAQTASPTAAQTAAQTPPGVQLSDIDLHPVYAYIGRAKFNAEMSGRPEDDYFGYPVSRTGPSKTGPGLSQHYYLRAVVHNTGSKKIKSVSWDMIFFRDAAKTEKLGCMSASLRGQVKPGQTKALKQEAYGPLQSRMSAHRELKLLRVVYTDGTAWESFDYLKRMRAGARPFSCGS
jgi:hypothetical protein